MVDVFVGLPDHSVSFFRYSYPIELRFKDGDQVVLTRFYSDFVQLRSDLITKSGLRNVPDIPAKEWDTNLAVRERRRVAFENFLKWCIKNAAKDTYVLGFLQMKSLSSSSHQVEPQKQNGGKRKLDFKEQMFVKALIFFALWFVALLAFVDQSSGTVTSVGEAKQVVQTPNTVRMDKENLETSKFVTHETTIVLDQAGHVVQTVVVDEVTEIQGNQVTHMASVETVIESENNVKTVEQIHQEAPVDEEEPISTPINDLNQAEKSEEISISTSTSQFREATADAVESSSIPNSEKVKLPEETNIDKPQEVISSGASQADKVEEIKNDDQSAHTRANTAESVESAFDAYLRQNTGSVSEDRANNNMSQHKKKTEFFLTPFNGTVSFIALCVFVLVWTKLFPATSGLSDTESGSDIEPRVLKKRSMQNVVVRDEPAVRGEPVKAVPLPPPQQQQQQQQQQNGATPGAFEEAKEQFAKLNLSEREMYFGNALLSRALGESTILETSVLNTSTKSLMHLRDEADALTRDEATERFVAFVQSRVRPVSMTEDEGFEGEVNLPSSTVTNVDSTVEQPVQALFVSPVKHTSSDELPTTPIPSSAAKETTPFLTTKSFLQDQAQSSPIPLAEASSLAISSFDSTDVSSLSISPAPVRVNTSGKVSTQLAQVPEVRHRIRKEEEIHENNPSGMLAQIAIGTVLGTAGAAVATTVARRVLSAIRG